MATLIDGENNAKPEEESQVQDLNKLIELSEEQKKFIEECEAEFSNCYTDDDLDYVNNKMNRDSCKKKPPIIEHWRGKCLKRRYDDRDNRHRTYNNYEQRHKRPRH